MRGDSGLFGAGSQCRLIQVALGGAGLSGNRGAGALEALAASHAVEDQLHYVLRFGGFGGLCALNNNDDFASDAFRLSPSGKLSQGTASNLFVKLS